MKSVKKYPKPSFFIKNSITFKAQKCASKLWIGFPNCSMMVILLVLRTYSYAHIPGPHTGQTLLPASSLPSSSSICVSSLDQMESGSGSLFITWSLELLLHSYYLLQLTLSEAEGIKRGTYRPERDEEALMHLLN